MARRKHDVPRGAGFIDERVTSSGAVRYRARWYEGASLRSKTFATQYQAEDHLRGIARAKRIGKYEPESRLTVEALLAEHFARMRKAWTSNTYANYVTIRDRIITPSIGKRLVTEIRPRDMRLFLDKMEAKYKPARVVVIKAVLSGAFRSAVELDIIDRNPLSDIRVKNPAPAKVNVWTAEEIKRLFAHVADKPRINAWYRLALSTGMRPGEMRALTWSNLNLDKGTMLICGTASRDERYRPIIKAGTKTGDSRKVRLPTSTVKALKSWRKIHLEERMKADSWLEMDLVFPRADGGLLSQQTQSRWHRKALNEAGVPYLNPHGMRHTFITLLLEEGMNEKLVGDIVGHSRPRQTMEYNQPTQRAHNAVMAFLEESYGTGEWESSMGESGDGGAEVV